MKTINAISFSMLNRYLDSYFDAQSPVSEECIQTSKETLERLKSAEENYTFFYRVGEEDCWIDEDVKYHLDTAERNLKKESGVLLKMIGEGVKLNLSEERISKLRNYSQGDFN